MCPLCRIDFILPLLAHLVCYPLNGPDSNRTKNLVLPPRRVFFGPRFLCGSGPGRWGLGRVWSLVSLGLAKAYGDSSLWIIWSLKTYQCVFTCLCVLEVAAESQISLSLVQWLSHNISLLGFLHLNSALWRFRTWTVTIMIISSFSLSVILYTF
jgi:hypothetical protein